MRNIMKLSLGLILATTLAATAFAQQPGRIRGEIMVADGANLELRQRDGSSLKVKVADDARVSALVPASMADLKNDTFVGIAGVPREDATIVAYSIHMFLPAQRGVVPDRHGPWDGRQGATMTNAYIEGTPVAGGDGQTFKVKYKDGEQKVMVTPQTVIAAAAPGSKDELKVGAQVIIFTSEKQADGSVLAKSLYVGRGVTPAM